MKKFALSSKFGPLGIRVDDRYRTIPEARILEMLLLVGWPYEIESASASEAAREVLQAWTEKGLGFRRAANGERCFDPVEVHNFMKREWKEGRDTFFSTRVVPTVRRQVSDLTEESASRFRDDGKRKFVVDFKRTFNLQTIPAGARLRLRAPLPLTGDYLKDLEVVPFLEQVQDAQIKISPGRLDVRMIASGESEAILGAKLSFVARPEKPCPSQTDLGSDRALYLSTREGLIVVSERVRTLARSLADVGMSSFEAMRAFWEYIHGELMGGALHYDQIDPASPCDWILDSGWFDCQMGSALFVALCRAHGMPARLVGGCVLYPTAPTRHYWAEVWSDDQGWTPSDFLSWDLSQGGRDTEWRDRFFGALDYRVTYERMPREFTGALGVPIPRTWCILQLPTHGGVEMNFLDMNGTPVYSDTVRIME